MLVGIAAAMVAAAAVFLVASYVADEDAGMKNKQAWEEYNANIPVIDSDRVVLPHFSVLS